MHTRDVITLGCRLNAFESEVMRDNLAAAGLSDTIVVNTCAVTSEAVRQSIQKIRSVRRRRPDARVIVTGCAAQLEPERFAEMAEVDHVIGNREKLFSETFQSLANAGRAKVAVDDINECHDSPPRMLAAFGGRTRAFVGVQQGCDHRCTFCIIPFARGPSRSLPAGAVVEQVKRLVNGGCVEIVLTGVDMTSYGGDLPGEMSLGRLVHQILKHVPELRRLRLSSIDQAEADVHMKRAFAEQPRLMPHLHLSLQSGDDLILKRMKRRHRRDDTIRFCAELRDLRPDIVFGADFIAGFPTETEAMFAKTQSLVGECELSYLHVFPYSSRAGTPAAKMPQVAAAEVKSRAARLRRTG